MKSYAQKWKPGSIKRIILFVVILTTIGVLLRCTYIIYPTFGQTEVKLIEKPAVLQAFNPVDDTLEPIDGIPEDIDEDYIVEVIEQVAEPIYLQPAVDNDVINILLVGTDVNALDKGTRSDTILLLSYSKEKKTAKLISFMRDVWISIPGYGMNRLNAAYAFGGVGLLVNTINENFDLDIQHYVTIDFDRFQKIVDVLGGIEVYLNAKEARLINEGGSGTSDPLPEEDGIMLLNGEQALSHCRNRSIGNGDFDRTRRQRQVMYALFDRVKVETNISTLSEILLSTIGYVKTNLSFDRILEIGLSAVTADNLSLEQGRIPFDDTWNYAGKDGRSVVEIDRGKNIKMLHSFLYEDLSDAPQRKVMLAD